MRETGFCACAAMASGGCGRLAEAGGRHETQAVRALGTDRP